MTTIRKTAEQPGTVPTRVGEVLSKETVSGLRLLAYRLEQEAKKS